MRVGHASGPPSRRRRFGASAAASPEAEAGISGVPASEGAEESGGAKPSGIRSTRSASMPVDAFQHVNTRSSDVERTKDFYVRLGFRVGDRPPFASKGYWLYLNDHPVLHLVPRKDGDAHHEHGGHGDHVAFHAVDLEGTKRALTEAGLPLPAAA